MSQSQTTVARFTGILSEQVGTPLGTDIVGQLNTFFNANPGIVVIDATAYVRGDDENSYIANITLAYQVRGANPSGTPPSKFGFPYRAFYMSGDLPGTSALSAADKTNGTLLNQWNQFYSKLVPLNLIRPGRLVPSDWIALMAQVGGTANLGNTGAPTQGMIAEPTAPILTQAVGPCILYDARGIALPGTYQIRNLSSVTWPTGDRNFATWEWSTSLLVGIPSCSGATPPLTTTTIPTTTTTTTLSTTTPPVSDNTQFPGGNDVTYSAQNGAAANVGRNVLTNPGNNKWFFEYFITQLTGLQQIIVGLTNNSANTYSAPNYLGASATPFTSVAGYSYHGQILKDGAVINGPIGDAVVGQYIQIAIDLDDNSGGANTGQFHLYYNGVLINSTTIGTYDGGAALITWYPAYSGATSIGSPGAGSFNFGATVAAFPIAGYKYWNTSGGPVPSTAIWDPLKTDGSVVLTNNQLTAYFPVVGAVAKNLTGHASTSGGIWQAEITVNEVAPGQVVGPTVLPPGLGLATASTLISSLSTLWTVGDVFSIVFDTTSGTGGSARYYRNGALIGSTANLGSAGQALYVYVKSDFSASTPMKCTLNSAGSFSYPVVGASPFG